MDGAALSDAAGPAAHARRVSSVGRVAWIARALLVALACLFSPASARADAPTRQVELLTIGVGPYLYARYGHSLLCVTEVAPAGPTTGTPGGALKGDCYDFGVPEPAHADSMFWESYRGRAVFITARIPRDVVLATFQGQDRTIERQRLALTAEETTRLSAALEASAARGDAYAYHPATANCATRVRDVLNEAVGDRLRQGAAPTTRATLRELMEEGLAGHPLELAAVELVSGPMNERYPSTWEAQMLPFLLRDAVAERLGSKPEVIYERVEYRLEQSVAAGRVLFLLVGLLLWGAISLAARPRASDPKRRALAVALKGVGLALGLLALAVDLVALTCAYPETHATWVLVALVPTDLALGWLPRLHARALPVYVRFRVAALAALVVLDVAGVVHQLLLPVVVLAALPMLGALSATRQAAATGPTPAKA